MPKEGVPLSEYPGQEKKNDIAVTHQCPSQRCVHGQATCAAAVLQRFNSSKRRALEDRPCWCNRDGSHSLMGAGATRWALERGCRHRKFRVQEDARPRASQGPGHTQPFFIAGEEHATRTRFCVRVKHANPCPCHVHMCPVPDGSHAVPWG